MYNYSCYLEESGEIPGSFAISWEQRKLGDMLISLQNNTLSRAELTNEAGVAKNVHYGDVLIKFGEVLDVSKEQLPMILDESVLSKYKASFLQNGDVIVADTAEDSTVGKCCEIAGLNNEVVLSGLHTIPYRPIEKFAFGYLGYYLNSSAYHNQLIPLMQGIKVTSISKSAMQDTDIVYPKSVEEQGKIGDYFQSLDHLITLHQRKQCILYIMEKILCGKSKQLGKSISWEQRKFSEMVIIERGGSPRPIDKFITNDENGLNWVKIGDAPEQGNYITKTAEKIKSEGLSKTREVHPGDLILSNSMSFGRPYIMAINGCIHDGWLAIRNTEKRFDLKFLCTLLGTDSMLDQYKAMAAGSTVNNLNKELVGSTTVSFPKIDEQVKIGEYFANLDNLIALHQRKP